MSLSVAPPRPRFGRYVLCDEIASGGMATVYFGRLVAPAGFCRTVALKRLHPSCAKDPELVAMLMDEARLASRVQHPNVVQVLDVVAAGGELVLVLEYVQGVPLTRLARRPGAPPPPAIASAIMTDVLSGLHAAHEARSELGEPLELVHRDVSPQNILVHENGITLVTDFGIARAVGRSQVTREGQIKGKPGYMAPEQIRGDAVTRRTDVFAAGVVLWEVFTGHRLFSAPNDIAVARKVLAGRVDRPSRVRPGIPPALDEVALRALSPAPEARFESAAEMLLALEQAVPPASRSAVAALVSSLEGDYLAERAAQVRRIEGERISGELPADDAFSAPLSSRKGDAVAMTVTPAPRSQDESTDPTGVSSPSRAQRSPSRAFLLWGALLGVLAGVLAGVRVMILPGGAGGEGAQGGATQPAAAQAAPPAEATVTPAAPSSAPPAASPEPAGTAPASATAPKTPAPGPTSRRAPAPAADCNPPSYVDSRGITVFKKQCLTKR